MNKKILDHYRSYGMFTYPGLYEEYLRSLPDDVREVGKLLRSSFIHRTTLEKGNTGTNADHKFGDMTEVPWFRQAEDDYLVTTPAIIAELFRRDERGLVFDRKTKNKVVLTCRYIALVFVSILKSKGIPARVRSGFAGYWPWTDISFDHWIAQYWSTEEKKWINVDVDGSFHDVGFDMYAMPEGKFDYSANAWLLVRSGEVAAKHFWNASDYYGLLVISWALFYDFHCLMNSEIIYLHHPEFTFPEEFRNISKSKLEELDSFSRLLVSPDNNFDELQKIWETNKEYRILTGALL